MTNLNRLPKQVYLKPEIRVCECDMEEQLLAFTVGTSGLDDDNLQKDGSGNSWDDAMGRRNNAWGDDEW